MPANEQPAADEPDTSPPPRERPWLLPYNRKLRHLQGITIRNLTLAPTPSRLRGKTIDDEAIPSTLKSPTKTLALRESKGLAHSRSSSDLKASEDAAMRNNRRLEPQLPSSRLTRPDMRGRLRRRSTLEWTGANPLTWQKKLEDITDSRMADIFFTLHVHDQEEPIYISEVAERAMNPNFRFFDLASCGPGITRLDKLIVKVWARNESTQGWQYLINFSVHLGSLQFIGKTLGTFRHSLPQNSILFHMTDGIYTSFIDMPVAEQLRINDLAPPKEHPEGRTLNSSSYDAIMRLNTLDDCIQDALATRDRLAGEIETILRDNREAIGVVEQVPEAEERLKMVEAAVTAEKRRVDAARRKHDELKANIERRRDLMRKGREAESEKEKEIAQAMANLEETKESLAHVQEGITGQRRRICEDLQNVFSIEPVTGKTLLFTIRGLFLPNGDFEDVKEDETAAALCYVAEMVTLLSPYFSVILPYPIKVHGSTSTIDDPLAMSTTSQNNPRTYPLFMKGVVRYRFEYGVFLLNKNIEILSNTLGVRPLDIRQTLPNLKYLLYVATAGKGELPARKAGGIKGLLRQQGVLSRTGSMDSTGTASSSGTAAPEPKPRIEIGVNGLKSGSQPGFNGNQLYLRNGLQKQKSTVIPGSRLREVE
ncbi:hypothetical protein N0V90_001455 [Kalmusia sp. IMI 367209]|nr:hypothetical protein N0V90_001455 [Kalmusia sp. IMI 367209]